MPATPSTLGRTPRPTRCWGVWSKATRPRWPRWRSWHRDAAPGETREVTLSLHADQTSYTGAAGRRQVDPGEVELRVGASSADIRAAIPVSMTGPRRHVGFDRVMVASVIQG
ncbi:fibronectin type III-like domain-contianing protein [Nonomuraea sp. M3C6]|uniref:Fibronectin type III-like domain-contianing protein n=1 Tax=Nonomuraea marmarensis TaxID=3351344 RepID=A0ABW7AJF7_9ACTN